MAFNNEFSGHCLIDIETIASPDCEVWLDPVQAPANYKDEAKIAAYCAEKRVAQIERAALEPDLCEIVAVGYHVNGETSVATRANGDERDLLSLLWGAISAKQIVGFNVLNFDLPVLIRRSQLLGLAVPSVNLDRYRTPHIDVLDRLSFNGRLTYRSLAFYCRRFNIPCEDDVKGSDMAMLVMTHAWDRIAQHVRADVDKTRALATRLGWWMA